MKKIAMVLHTNGLEYDDRIRKEMLTLIKLYPDIYFKIFAIVDSKQNKYEEGITDYGIDYCIPFLKSRVKYKPATHLYRKAWDFYRTVSPMLQDYDAVWCADFDVVFFILLCNKRLIWDMHELPSIFLGNSLKKFILKFLMKRCKVILHANSFRLNYLKQVNALCKVERHLIVRNFPDFNEGQKLPDQLFNKFKDWKGNDSCVYLQGLNSRSRSAIEAISSVMMMDNVKGVVVGGFPKDCKDELVQKFGDKISKKLFFTGLVPQPMTPLYIRECSASLVLYKNISPNNYYCEPNRMFQSIMNDCPVVVGNNPPMKDMVEKYGLGAVLDDDGSSTEIISRGLQQVLEDHEIYLRNILINKDKISWGQQIPVFKDIISKLFS